MQAYPVFTGFQQRTKFAQLTNTHATSGLITVAADIYLQVEDMSLINPGPVFVHAPLQDRARRVYALRFITCILQ